MGNTLNPLTRSSGSQSTEPTAKKIEHPSKTVRTEKPSVPVPQDSAETKRLDDLFDSDLDF